MVAGNSSLIKGRSLRWAHAPTSTAATLVVGFDLDMTLIDTASGLRRDAQARSATELGVVFPVEEMTCPPRPAARPDAAPRTCRPRPSSRRSTASGPSTPTTPSRRARCCPGAHEAARRRTPPRRPGRPRHREVRTQRPAARRPPRARRRPPGGRGVGSRQGRRARREGRLDLRRRPRPRRRGRAGRRRHQRLACSPAAAPARSSSRPAPTSCSTTSTSSPPGSTSTCSTTRLAALEADLRGAWARCWSPTAGEPTARSCWPPPCGPSAPTGCVAATATPTRCPSAERDPARDFAEALGVRRGHPGDARDGARGLPAPTPATAATSARPSCSTCSRRWPPTDGLAHVATGTNADDAVAGFRPGIRAAAERGAITPLLDAGLTKAQVREASRRWGLPTWDKPAAACLSLPGRLRHRGHPAPAGPGRARRGRRTPGCSTRAGVRRRGTCGCATSATAPRSRSTRRCWPARWRHGVAARGRCVTPSSPPASTSADARPARLPVRLDERAARAAPTNRCAGFARRHIGFARRARHRVAGDATSEADRQAGAHWQGEVVRRGEGLRLPVPGRRTGRLRALRALPEG